MLDVLPADLAHYIETHSAAEPPLLAELRDRTQATLADPQMQVGPVEGALLGLLVAISGAHRVLEIGTFSGYSALCMADALPPHGTLITCECDPTALAVAREFFARSPVGDRIEPRLGPAAETLAQLTGEGRRFDFVFIDADKVNYVPYYEAVMPLLVPGGLLVADNTLWSGRVIDPHSQSDHGMARFNDHVHNDPRVTHVMLSVRDGITLARKR